jgi:hypothetical protein
MMLGNNCYDIVVNRANFIYNFKFQFKIGFMFAAKLSQQGLLWPKKQLMINMIITESLVNAISANCNHIFNIPFIKAVFLNFFEFTAHLGVQKAAQLNKFHGTLWCRGTPVENHCT